MTNFIWHFSCADSNQPWFQTSANWLKGKFIGMPIREFWQTPGNISQFGIDAIHSDFNLVALDKDVHRQISSYYSSITRFTDGLTVRQWLSNQSFVDQYNFGINQYNRFKNQ